MFYARGTAWAKAVGWKFKGPRKKASPPGGQRLLPQALGRAGPLQAALQAFSMDFYFYPKRGEGGVAVFIVRRVCFTAVKVLQVPRCRLLGEVLTWVASPLVAPGVGRT